MMRNRILMACLIVGVLLPGMTAFAVKLPSLYQVDIPVVSQADDVKSQAMKQGFIQVLTKVSGQAQIEKNPDVSYALKNPSSYVQEFGYISTDSPILPYTMRLTFDKRAVSKLLKRSGVAYWGETRPLVLVWLAVVNSDQTVDIVTDEIHSDILKSLREQSKKLSLPLIFPVMDAAEMNKVIPEEVADMDMDALNDISKPYSPDGMLIGSIEITPQGYRGTWRLIVKDDQWDWTTSDKTPAKMVSSTLEEASQAMAKQFVSKEPLIERKRWVSMQVVNVAERQDLTELVDYLKQLPAVQRVHLSEISEDAVALSVQILGPENAFLRNVEDGQRMVLKAEDNGGSRFIYEWVH